MTASLRVVGEAALPVYPLRRGQVLTNRDYFSCYHHALLGSGWVARTQPEHWGVALMLWAQCIGSQDPGGTLPDDDVELCRLAELGRDIGRWRGLRAGALDGWQRVQILDDAGLPCGVRLAHPRMTAVAEAMFDELEAARTRAADSADRVARHRLRQQIGRVSKAMAGRPEAVEAVRRWLAERGLGMAARHVREACEAVSSGGGFL